MADRRDRCAVVWAAAVAMLAGSLGPQAAWADSVTLGYEVAWGNFTLAEAEVSYRQAGTRYHLAGSGRTQGLLDLFVSWQGRAETRGELGADGRRPVVHQHQGTWGVETRRTRVAWDQTALPLTDAEPPPDPEEVTPVPAAATKGTSDPFTVLLSVLDQLAETGRCEAEAKVWDGRRRYDLSVEHLGEETLVADRPWSHQGPAIKCALAFERIGGFWREPPDWRDDDENDAADRLVWAAEIAPGRWALVRAELETAYGTVVGRLLPEGGLGDDG